MAARHPAPQRAPSSQHTDHRDQRHPPAHRPRAHLRRGSTASQHSSDADHDGGPTVSPRSSTHTSTGDQHAQHRPTSRPYSQTSSQGGDGPHDSSSEESDLPQRHLRSSRHTSGATGARRGPADTNTHGQHSRPSDSVDEGTLGPHHAPPRRVTQHGQGGGAGQGRGGQVEERPFRPGTRRESTRAGHEGVRAGMRSFDDPSNRAASGTDPYPPPQSPPHPPRPMPAEDPYVPEPGSAMHQQLPVYQFNRDRYPAYDVHARRIGLEHVRNESSAPQPGQYYRARTHNYPGPNVSAADYPHVMNIDLNVTTPVPPETGGSSRSRMRRVPASSPHRNSSARDPGPDREHSVDDDFDIPRRGSPSPMPGHCSSRAVNAEENLDHERTGTDTEHPAEAEADGPPINSTPYLRTMLGLGPEDEVSLNALADPPEGEKPNYPYPTLIKLAIHGSRNKRLTLQDIYQALEDRFEWYRANAEDKSWQNSIRHNLSLNKCFRRVPRPITEPGKGSFWTVDYSQGTGNKRERKRNKKPTKAQLRKLAEEEARAAEGRDDLNSPVSAGGSTASHYVPPSDSSRGGISPIGETGHKSPTVECNFPNPSRSSSLGTPTIIHGLSDAHIDPALRDQGHVVGEGRTRAGHDLARRKSSGFLPPVQIRQSARINPRQSTYDSAHSRSPSPHTSGLSRAATTSFAVRPTAPTSAPAPHTFGRNSLHTGVQPNQYSWPSPANWERYGQNLQPPLPATSLRPATSSNNNALLLSGVPSSSVAGPSTYGAGPSNTHTQPTRSSTRPEATSSRLPVSNYREGTVNARRPSNRRVYTDSRGNEYPAQGDSYSSASE